MPRSKPPYAPEFRNQMVEMVRAGSSPEKLAREFEPTAQTIRNWVAQADRDVGRRTDGLTSAEREELRKLRRENRQLHLLGYLISRFKTARSYQHSYLASLREHFGDLAFDTVVPDLAGYEKSVTHCLPITLRQPSSREAEIARQLFDEVCGRIAKSPF